MGTLKHLVSVDQLTDSVIQLIFERTDMLRNARPDELSSRLRHKGMATLFYQESTRTRLSFERAMQILGGQVISTVNALQLSSVAKGESDVDTVRTIGQYADVIVVRHHINGSVAKMAEVSPVPIINAGDGPGDHPPQALLDLYTIKKKLGTYRGLTVVLAGDCKRSRTIHPLAKILARHDNHLLFVSRPSLRIPDEIRNFLRASGCRFEEHQDLESVLPGADVIYMTRDQDNLSNPSDREDYQIGNPIILHAKIMKAAKQKSIIMHPLPRRSELDISLNADPRLIIFDQVKNGLYIRTGVLDVIVF